MNAAETPTPVVPTPLVPTPVVPTPVVPTPVVPTPVVHDSPATDLTFQTIADIAPANSFVTKDGKLFLDLSAFSDIPVSDLSSGGVIELAYRLFLLANRAQNIINKTQSVGNRLVAFGLPAHGQPQADSNGNLFVPSTLSLSVKIKVPLEGISGNTI